MKTLFEIIGNLLNRPLVTLAGLTIAATAVFTLAQRGMLTGLPDDWQSGTYLGSLVIAAIASSIFVMTLVANAWPHLHDRINGRIAETTLLNRIRKLDADAQAVICCLSARNERTIWLDSNYPGGHLLRAAGLAKISDKYGTALELSVDYSVLETLERRIGEVQMLMTSNNGVSRLFDAERKASEARDKSWMAV